MERRVSPTLRRLLAARRLLRERLGSDAVEKEMKAAEYDLERSGQSFRQEDYKWATIKAYYSMFHAARALLYSAGYRERSHSALISALRELYVKTGLLREEALNDFENAMSLRESADYGHTFSKEGAERVMDDAKQLYRTVKEVMKS